MRFVSATLAALASCAFASAQSTTVDFGIYPDATTFTSRGGLPDASAGDVLLRAQASEFRGVGQVRSGNATVGRLEGFRFVLQDEDASTRQSFNLVMVRDDPGAAGRPDTSAAGVILRTAPLQSPSGVGRQAWQVTVTLTTPANVIPQSSSFHFGVGLPAQAAQGDVLTIHGASFTLGTQGDNPAPVSGNPVHNVIRPTNQLGGQIPSGLTNNMKLRVPAGVLNVGADVATAQQRGPNPSFGFAGLYPNGGSTRRDGLAFRVRDLRAASGIGAVFVSAATTGPGFAIGGLDGLIYLDPLSLTQISSLTIPASGEVVSQPSFLAQGQIPIGVIGSLRFQAVTAQGQSLHMTNAVTVVMRVL